MALAAVLARAAAPLLLRARMAASTSPALSRRRLLTAYPADEPPPPPRPPAPPAPAAKMADPEPESPPWRATEAEMLSDIEPVVLLIKDILHSDRYGDGECLGPKDENVVVEKLLSYHPRAEDKIGCGLDAIMRALCIPPSSSVIGPRNIHLNGTTTSAAKLSWLEPFLGEGHVFLFVKPYYLRPHTSCNVNWFL